VENRRQITEEDILMTEAMIARSYGRLKRSVAQAPSQALSAMGGTIRKHPLASAAVAAGAGLTLYGIFRLATRPATFPESRSREQKSRSDMKMEIFSMILPIITPYIVSYLEKYLGKVYAGKQDKPA
jgi:hypothetical protein